MAIVWCRGCEQYHQTQGNWYHAFKSHVNKINSAKQIILKIRSVEDMKFLLSPEDIIYE